MSMLEGNLSLENTSKPTLKVHEWLAVVTIIVFLSVLTFISVTSRNTSYDSSQGVPHHLTPPIIEVCVQGAVENPGNYQVPPGTFVVDVLEKAKPFKTADLRNFKPTCKLRNGQIVNVKAYPMISIEVTGAVLQPTKISIPKGTKLNELAQYIQLSENADMTKLQKKRRLSDGETIVIPSTSNRLVP